jgi:glutathione S-transferase
MTLILYYHPFSSYCQKALMGLYEKELEFEAFKIDLADARQRAEFAAVWPYAKFPVLHDIGRGATIPEATLIVEHAEAIGKEGPRLIPEDPTLARNVRLLDRILDNYLHTPLQKIVGDRLRPEDKRDPYGVAEARALIAKTYQLLEQRIGTSGWITGPNFTMADCAAAPPLFYAAKLVPMEGFQRLENYLIRLLDRPSFRRCLDEARDFRPLFPAEVNDRPWIDEQRLVRF